MLFRFYGVVPEHLQYPDCTMYEAVERCAQKYPSYPAYVFMGRKTSYRALVAEINLCARALKAIGVRPGDKITMAMPNCPQAVTMFYAINLVGATANMIHPLSSENEIEFYLKESGSLFAVTLDQFYHKFEAIRQNVTLDNIILASIPDALSRPVRVGYMLTEGRKQARIPKDAPVLRWHEFLRRGLAYHWRYKAEKKAQDEAVILYSGGDSLSVELKKRFDKFLFDHHATIQVREGYGLTECVTASCLTPYHISREGSIGIPFPDTYYKIVEHGTQKEVPYGTEGEICLSGPTVMMGYLHHPEETAQTLQTHEDGLTWVHTGDLGYMDPDGFVYFRQRLKRMIVTSGYNVYPSQMENILDAHELVQMSCVIGVPDPLKMQKVKAFVMLKPGVPANEETKAVLMAYIRKNVAKYALPYDIEFRAELPKTLVGKVAYRVLEEEELKKLSETAQEQ